MGMGDGPLPAGGAGGEEDIGQPVGIAQGIIGGLMRGEAVQIGHDRAGQGTRQGDAVFGQDQVGLDQLCEGGDLGRGQRGGGRDRDQPDRDAGKVGDGESRPVAEAEKHAVTGDKPLGQQPRRHPAHGVFEPRIAPTVGAGRRQHRQRHLVGMGRRRRQHMGGKVEGGGAGHGSGGKQDADPWQGCRIVSG